MLLKASDYFRNGTLLALAAAAPLIFVASAKADVTISSAATQNMSCSGGVCAPTAAGAVLNAGDLETLLASGNVEVTTTGSGVQGDNIVVGDALSWSATSALTLDAYQSVSIDKNIAVQGQGGLTLATNDGGTNGALAFGHKGGVTFANLSSNLIINGTAYTLVNTIQSLASAVAANPSGAYALASAYDAALDGTYSTVPVPTPFTGTFEGLGNAISNLSIDDPNDTEVGLFAEVDIGGTLRDISVSAANVSASAANACAGTLVGWDYGSVIHASASGSVESKDYCAGGLVGKTDGGTIVLSHAATKVSGVFAGGLVGFTVGGSIDESFATGKASATEYAGGLVGEAGSFITNCYATGAAKAPKAASDLGGFDGADNEGSVSESYSTGRVIGGTTGAGSGRGGFVGITSETPYNNDYWDTDTSGFTNTHRGAGNVKNQQGIAGLKTRQLKSGLPPGFDPSIWGENKKFNGGFPYLLANPPH